MTLLLLCTIEPYYIEMELKEVCFSTVGEIMLENG